MIPLPPSLARPFLPPLPSSPTNNPAPHAPLPPCFPLRNIRHLPCLSWLSVEGCRSLTDHGLHYLVDLSSSLTHLNMAQVTNDNHTTSVLLQ